MTNLTNLLCILAISFAASTSMAAVASSPRDSAEYLTPAESMSVLRGSASICTAESPQGGHRGFSYIQLGRGKCSGKVGTAVGWDRPEEESTSPGIPFKGRGL